MIEYTKRAAQLSAKLELKAESLATPVRRTDALITAIVMNRGALLYTFNLKHLPPLLWWWLLRVVKLL